MKPTVGQKLVANSNIRPIAYNPYYMVHITWFILYGTYYINEFIWKFKRESKVHTALVQYVIW